MSSGSVSAQHGSGISPDLAWETTMRRPIHERDSDPEGATLRDGAAVLTVEHLTKVFRTRGAQGQLVVDDVGFELARGGSLAVVGESGSGKTTIARIVAGLESATSGTIRIDGQPVDVGRRAPRKRAARVVQMVFQDPFASLDPRQQIAAGLRELLIRHFDLDKQQVHDRVRALLDQVGLDERHASKLPRALSGGERQRVAIARALALEPKILILDEAVAALDVSIQAQVLNLLTDIRHSSDVSYLFVSHDLAVVRQVTDTCLVLNRGRVVEQGPTPHVLDNPRDPYTRRLIEAVPRPGWKPSRRSNDPST
jgi:ABC-type glutathione transport system ATPase component